LVEGQGLAEAGLVVAVETQHLGSG
jgi:hypothetical protein